MSYPPQGEPELPINLETKDRHRREVWWQIFLPLFLGVILVGALVFGITLTGVGDTSVWAEVSLIWVIIPLLIAALIPLVILIGIVVGLTWLIKNTPPYAFQVQAAFDTVEAGVRRVMDRATEPFLRFHSELARLKAVRGASKTKQSRE
jgi:lipopolysaccharide export LptBFGC system permease protein LptF